MIVLVFIVLGMVLVSLARFAEHVMRTRGGWYGLAAALPFLIVVGVLAYLVQRTL